MQAANSARKGFLQAQPRVDPAKGNALLGFPFWTIPKMSNMKTVSLIAAELKNEADDRRLDIVSVIQTVDDELTKITHKLKDLEERLDLLEHQ